MSVREYIGARYVPVLADPIQWSNEREYEPLTIVLHQGNSYTSVQSVPVGVDITNESFWAVTGNYNAQIEQYRKETQVVAGGLNEVVEMANNLNATIQGQFEDAGAALKTETHERIAGDMQSSIHTSSYAGKTIPLTNDMFTEWDASVTGRYNASYYDPVEQILHIEISAKLSGAVNDDLTLCKLPSVVPYIPENMTFVYQALMTKGKQTGHRDVQITHDATTKSNSLFINTPTVDDDSAGTYAVINFTVLLEDKSITPWSGANVSENSNQLYLSAVREPDPDAFNLLVSSDWHAQWRRANIGGGMNYHFDGAICLGDIVNERPTTAEVSAATNSYNYWGSTMKVLGNHDVVAGDAYPNWDNVTGNWGDVDWTKTNALSTSYQNFFANYVSSTGITIQPNKCWWYKDYSGKKVKLIGLYCMAVRESERTEQTNFLYEQLNDAKNKGYQVIIANHWAYNDASYIQSNFTDNWWLGHEDMLTSLNEWEHSMIQAVDNFIVAGGKFACWLVGHSHGDNLGYYSIAGRKQLIVNMCAEKPASIAQMYRTNDSLSELAFDGLQLNSDGSIILTRYGCTRIIKGGIRDVIYM